MATEFIKGREYPLAPTGLGGVSLKDNLVELNNSAPESFAVNRDPGVNDDVNGLGGESPSFEWATWRNTVTKDVFVCLDSSAGAADWILYSSVTLSTIKINNAAQFEEQASAGVITITADTCFLIHAIVTTPSRFVINTGVTLRITSTPGVNPFSLTYSGTGNLFSGAGSVVITDILLLSSSTGTLASIDGGSLLISRSSVNGFDALGSISNGAGAFLRFVIFSNIGTGLTMTDMSGTQIFSITHIGTGLTTPFFIYNQKLANVQMSMATVNLRLGTGGSVIDISTDNNNLAPITIDNVTAITGDLFKQTTVAEVAITAVADASIANGTITAMADNSDSGTTISSTSVYFDGEQVTISSTTSYNGTFRIFNVVASTSFDIQVAFVADDATGTIVTERIGLTVGGGHGIVATDNIKVKDTNFYNAFSTVLIAAATLITINGTFVSTNTGNIERDVSLDQTDPRVTGDSNPGTADSHSIASTHVNDNSTANGPIVNSTFTDMVFGTVGAALIASSTMERVKLVNELNGTFECLVDDFDGFITFDFTVQSTGGTVDFRFKWLKDIGSGFVDLEDVVESLVAVGSNAQSVTKTFPLMMNKGDQIKPQITRNSGTSGITTIYATIYATG